MKKSSKKEHDKSYGLRLIISIIIVVVLMGLALLASLAIHTANLESQERKKFDDLKNTADLIYKRFEDNAANLSWSSPIEKCVYHSGTGLADGGWTCGASFGVTVKNTGIKDQLVGLRQIIQESGDTLSDYREDTLEIQSSNKTHAIYVVDKKTSTQCQLYFAEIELDLYVLFECKSGAQKSWYPNDEPSHSTIFGKDAWK